ncbi:carboxypeptidase-like regulatory domain-containing protein [Flavobacterium sp. RSB2_4_14]|uniref:carboxypeptidase-like regulatory domain-containing protein n=1 Tax=Flavobacterium sp. RSB2_4_14 TaxID=3447665 RepID=UPI003F3A2CB4
MTSVQSNKVNMFLVVIENLRNQAPETLQSIPNFNQLFEEFKSKFEELQQNSSKQSASGKGLRIDKLDKKDIMISLALNTANCVRAYADSINNIVLEKSMTFTKTRLIRLRELSVATSCSYIHTIATQNSQQLIPYGITQTTLDELKDAISQYEVSNIQPRTNILKKKTTTQKIKELINECNTILERMDKLVKILKLTNPRFVESYYFSRKTINRHGSKLAIRGIITNEDGTPIQGAKIKIAKIKNTATTTTKGYFEFKNLPPGFHKITITHPNYKPIEEQVGTIKRMRLQLNRTMQPVQENENVA